MVPPPSFFRRIQKALRSFIISTLLPLKEYHYTLYDLQYVFLFTLFSFCYWIMDKPVWFKLPIALTFIVLLIPRRTRHFLLPFFAVAAWLILFYCCRFIPSDWRPHIFTSVLPALENILYGGSISELLASTTSPAKDILAWIPYGVLHYVLPIVTAILITIFGPPGTLPVFARTFGYMNVAGVLTQIMFPCAPPWYETRYGGFQPATYTMPGDPGGLARVDDILGIEMYKTTFTASPLVFGAFPSLHSADACQLAFFLVYVFGPRSIPFAMSYILWIWWATMYLGHHYVVDLVGGGAYAVIAFWIGSHFLPSVLPPQDDDDEDEEKFIGETSKAGGIRNLEEAMGRHEKQTLFSLPEYDEEDDVDIEAGSSSGSSIGGSVRDQNVDRSFGEGEASFASMEMNSIMVVNTRSMGRFEMERAVAARMTFSEPSSPTGSHHSSSSSSSSSTSQKKKLPANYRQSWSGWQGYESWVEVLVTVNTPKTSPKTSPKSSPKSSPPPSPRTSTVDL
ncbi:Aureobasidin resistance protein Aur1 [Mortierella sp. AD011]|nr:Aureobasidin resistance protein Aur1 [Mortierella sp. AD010]KAF9403157.1 Aureobasidin resistance protein Aur1 [Mortierella sp. AD011]